MADAEAVRARAEARRAKLLAKSEDRLKAIEKREVKPAADGGMLVDAVCEPASSAAVPSPSFEPAAGKVREPAANEPQTKEKKMEAKELSSAPSATASEAARSPPSPPPSAAAGNTPGSVKKPIITGDLPPLIERRRDGAESSAPPPDRAAQGPPADVAGDPGGRPPRRRTQLEFAHAVLRGTELQRTAAALVMGIVLGAVVLRPQPVLLFLSLEACAVAAGAQLLASAPKDGKSAFAKWIARGSGDASGNATETAGAGDPQPQWLRTGASLLGMFSPGLKAKVPVLLGGFRVAGAVADDFAVFILALLLSRFFFVLVAAA